MESNSRQTLAVEVLHMHHGQEAWLNEHVHCGFHDELKRWLAAHPVIQLGILFGSLVEGRADVESDLDLAVMGRRPLTASEKQAAIAALAEQSGHPVDLIDLQTLRGPLLGRILRTGIRIYCDDSALHAELIKRHVFDQADWLPIRDRILAERRHTWIDA